MPKSPSSKRSTTPSPKSVTPSSISICENLNYFLGIDIGLSIIKITIVDRDKFVVYTTKQEYNADIGKLKQERHEIDPLIILQRVEKMMVIVSSKCKLERIKSIAVSGQIHGIVRFCAEKLHKEWKTLKPKLNKESGGEAHISSVITGKDRRGFTTNYAASMPPPLALNALVEGNGCVTLGWLHKYDRPFKHNYDSCGTIADLLVMRLTKHNKVSMTEMMAATWGYYIPAKNTTSAGSWETNKLRACGVADSMLPEIVKGGSLCGSLTSFWHGIPAGVPVLSAIPDVHACFYAFVTENPNSAILNITSSSQLVMQMKPGFDPPLNPRPSGLKYYPYLEGKYLAVGSSNNGQNVVEELIIRLKDIAQIMANKDVDENIVREKIEQILNSEDKNGSPLQINPLLQPETHIRTPNGIINVSEFSPVYLYLTTYSAAVLFLYRSMSVKADNFTVRNLMIGVVQGVVNNIFNTITVKMMIENNINNLILVGNANTTYYRNAINRTCESKLKLVTASPEVDSAYGVALFAHDFLPRL